MKRNCDLCDKQSEDIYRIEKLETPNFRWNLCLECFIDLERGIKALIERMKEKKK
jgi:hypothetical protein